MTTSPPALPSMTTLGFDLVAPLAEAVEIVAPIFDDAIDPHIDALINAAYTGALPEIERARTALTTAILQFRFGAVERALRAGAAFPELLSSPAPTGPAAAPADSP